MTAPLHNRRSFLTVLASTAILLVGGVGLLGQVVRSDRVVAAQRSSAVVHDAHLDDSYYQCVETQVHSLISEDTPVRYRRGATLGEKFLLNRVAAGWVTLSAPGAKPFGWLGVRRSSTAPSCLGDVVTLRTRDAEGRWIVHLGSGASVPGHGPPPAPPL